jgi:hypothetical protein
MLHIVPAEVLLVECIHARVESVAARVGRVDHASCTRPLTKMFVRRRDVVSAVDFQLHFPVLAEHGGRHDAVLRVGVVRIKEGMAVGAVVRRELCLDVGNGDIAPHAHVLALEEMREVEIEVIHHRIETIEPFVFGVLTAQYAV